LKPKKVSHQLLPKLLLISVPVILWIAWQLSLPNNQYVFRIWESILNVRGLTNGPFYPRISEEMVEVGGMAPYTAQAVPRFVHWTTDQYGNRNRLPLCLDQEVIVLGDSMAIGDSMDDSDILSAQLSSGLNHCVRSVAGGKLGHQAERMFELNLSPHWVIFVVAQYAITDLLEIKSFKMPSLDQVGILESNPILDQIKVAGNRIRKNMYWNYRATHGLFAAIYRSFLSPHEATSLIAPAPQTPSMIFSSPKDGRYISDDQITNMVEAMERFTTQLHQRNIQVIFTIVPQKEEIYSDLAKVAPSSFSEKWLSKTTNKSFHYVDLFASMRALYQEKRTFFHHLDDNHWNKTGVQVLAESIIPLIKKEQK